MTFLHISGQIAHALFEAHCEIRQRGGPTDSVFEDLREKIADILIEQRVKFNRVEFINRCIPPGLLIDSIAQ